MRRLRRTTNEDGAALIIALVFMVTMGLLIGVLVTLADTNLLATTHLETQRNWQYAADSALEIAVQTVRYTPSSCASPEGLPSVVVPPWPSKMSVTVWCASAPLSGVGARQVMFWACPSTSSSDCQQLAENGGGETSNSLIARAQVLINDVTPSCPGFSNPCQPGTSLIVEQWSVTSANG
jgi:hypothetical protein